MSIAELATLEAWQATSPTRREEIARGLATSHGLEFEQVAPFRREDLPLASYRGMDGLFRFVLVPGGTYDMGHSDAELSVLTTLAEPHRAEPSFDQRWGGLFVDPSPMRPVTRVTVGPCLVAQNAMGDFALDEWRKEMGEALVGEGNDASTLPEDLEVAFVAHGFRLPTEVEWEWFARGGRMGELRVMAQTGTGVAVWGPDNQPASLVMDPRIRALWRHRSARPVPGPTHDTNYKEPLAFCVVLEDVIR